MKIINKIVLTSLVFTTFLLLSLVFDSKQAWAQNCTDQGGQCSPFQHNRCPDAFEPQPIGGYGELGCSNTERCCVPLTQDCYTRIPSINCRDGTSVCVASPTVCCVDIQNCPAGVETLVTTKLCQFTGDQQECLDCVGSSPTGENMWTAIGCIPVSPQGLISSLLTFAIGIGGGIAFLMIVYGGFVMMTSSGNPERLTTGKEIITSAVAGLLLIIFSVVILKIIGVDILKIPGFGG